jgi:hypothetical protein
MEHNKNIQERAQRFFAELRFSGRRLVSGGAANYG